jgi:hypothetical protein
MSSVNTANIQSYQDALKDFGPHIVQVGFFGFKTAQHVHLMEGIKNSRVLTELKIGKHVKAYNSKFNPSSDIIGYKPRTITVRGQKSDLEIVPQDFEYSYMGNARKKGQNPGQDMPLEAEHLMAIQAEIGEENDAAIWQGELDETIAVDNRYLMDNVDGYLTIIARELAMGNLTPYAVQGGGWTASNTVQNLENMYKRLAPQIKSKPLKAYAATHIVENYKTEMRERFLKYTGNVKADDQIMLDFGQVELVSMPGMGNSNRVIITPEQNIIMAFDDMNDPNVIRMKEDIRCIKLYTDYKIGAQFGIIDNRLLSVCDLV